MRPRYLATLVVAACITSASCGRVGFHRPTEDAGTPDGALRVDGGAPTDGSTTSDAERDAEPDAEGAPPDASTMDGGRSASRGRIAASEHNVCFVTDLGAIRCAGVDTYGTGGQLGDGMVRMDPGPVVVANVTDGVSAFMGIETGCVIRSDRTVACWGGNATGAIGDGTTTTRYEPVVVPGLDRVTSISGPSHTYGQGFTCATREDGTLWCWGHCEYGTLGDGRSGEVGCFSATPIQVPGITDAALVSARRVNACLLHRDGTVSCWGERYAGAIGDGGPEAGPYQATPSRLPGLTGVVDLAVGYRLGCAARSDGTVWCWGRNNEGSVGDGTFVNRTSPVQVVGITDAIAVRANLGTVCAILSDGSTSCWGASGFNQRLDDTLVPSALPVAQTLIPRVRDLALGDGSCAYTDDGVFCWGSNRYGQLGLGRTMGVPSRATPQTPSAFTRAPIKLALGTSATCAIDAAGMVECVGANRYGSLGNGTVRAVRSAATTMILPRPARELRLGDDFACALLDDATVACAGSNAVGQLGNPGAGPSSATALLVPGLTDVVELAAGPRHACARTGDGRIHCWGGGSFGIIGNGTNGVATAPAVVTGITDAIQIAAGGIHNCALLASGEVRCWGDNYRGNLGDGTMNRSNVPVTVIGLTATGRLFLGFDHSCATMADGGLVCWGRAEGGLLGAGVTMNSAVPVAVAGISNADQLAMGPFHTCSTQPGGGLLCWGLNLFGTRAIEPIGYISPPPNVVAGLPPVAEIYGAPGSHSICAKLTDATFRCWGDNHFNQLGNGDDNMQIVHATGLER